MVVFKKEFEEKLKKQRAANASSAAQARLEQPNAKQVRSGRKTDSRFSLPGTSDFLNMSRMQTEQSIKKQPQSGYGFDGGGRGGGFGNGGGFGSDQPWTPKIKSDWAKQEEKTKSENPIVKTIDKAFGMTQDILNYDLRARQISEDEAHRIATGQKNKSGKNASIGEIIGNGTITGMAGAQSGLAKSVDFLIPTDFLGKYDPFSAYSKYKSKNYETLRKSQEYNIADRGKTGEVISNLSTGTGNALMSMVLALLNPGGGTSASLGSGLSGVRGTLSSGLKSIASNPLYWNSFLSTVGSDYEEARKAGGSEMESALTAITASLLNSAVEVGGGIETLPGKIKAPGVNQLLTWFQSGVEEGGEEVIQKLISGVTQKAIADPDKQYLSLSDETAIVNPKSMAEDFGYGTGVGLILGGGPMLAQTALDRSGSRRGVETTVEQTPADTATAILNAPAARTTDPRFSEAAQSGSDVLDGRQNRPSASQGNKARSRMRSISFADFSDNSSPVWTMLEYGDVEQQDAITRDIRQQMIDQGAVVELSGEQAAQYYPDLRSMKKAERTPILKQKITALKQSLRAVLSQLKGSTYEFEVNGNILEARLYDTGIKEVLEKITQEKAGMLFGSDEIFRKARYLYSTPDYGGDPNVYRWNYFYTPVSIDGGEPLGVRIAVRDVASSSAGSMDSQIYNWNIKKNAPLDGGQRGRMPDQPGISSGAFGESLGGGKPGQVPNMTGASSDSVTELPVQTSSGESLGGEGRGHRRRSNGASSDSATELPVRTSAANLQSVRPVNISDSIPAVSIPQSGAENNADPAQMPMGNPVQGTRSAANGQQAYSLQGHAFGDTIERKMWEGGYADERKAARTTPDAGGAAAADSGGQAQGGAVLWSDAARAYAGREESLDRFSARAAAEQKETFQVGGTTYAVHPVQRERWSPAAVETVRLLADYGIPAMVHDGTVEANTNGVTTTTFSQGGTLRDGSVAVHNRAEVPPRLLAAHEMYHAARRQQVPEADVFYETICNEIDYGSERTCRYLDFIASTYFKNNFDILQDADQVMEEFAAAISGDLYEPTRSIQNLFQNEKAVRQAWNALDTAMRRREALDGPKNAADAEPAVNENGLVSLSKLEQDNLSSGKRNKIVSTFRDAVAFIRDSLSDKQSSNKAYLGKVTPKVAKMVLEQTGVDIGGYNAILPSDAVRHMFKHHGNVKVEAFRGQVALTPEAAANISTVLSAPDRVTLSKKPDVFGRKTLLFEKRLGSVYVTAQAVTDGTKSLITDTLYIKKGSPTTVDGPQSASNQTSETSSGLTLSENSIPQSGAKNNANPAQMPMGNPVRDIPGPRRSPVTEAASLNQEQPVHVGRATTLQAPYHGQTPTYVRPKNRVTPQIDRRSVLTAAKEIQNAKALEQESGKSFRNFLTDFYERLFQKRGGAHEVVVSGLSMNEEPYAVTINKSAIGKVISDKNMTPQKLAVFDMLDEVIQNGEYVGSNQYTKKSKKQKNTIRFDLFETPVQIDGENYLVTFDVEVFPNTNNYRTHKVINEMDLVAIDSAGTGTHQPQSHTTQGPIAGKSTDTESNTGSMTSGPAPYVQNVPPSDFPIGSIPQSGAKNNADPAQIPAGDSVQNIPDHGQPRAVQETTPQETVDRYVDHAISKSRFVDSPLIVNETVPDLPLGPVSPELADKMRKEYGLDISGKQHVLNDNDIRHIFNRHGPHTPEAMPVTAEDIKAIPYIIQNADDVYYLPRRDGKSGLMYQYRHNGTTYYLEQIVENEAVLRNKQMIKVPTGTIPDVKGLREAINKKHADSLPGDAADAVPRMYVQDVRNGVFSKDTIPQSGAKNNVNPAQISMGNPVRDIPERGQPQTVPDFQTWQAQNPVTEAQSAQARETLAREMGDVLRDGTPMVRYADFRERYRAAVPDADDAAVKSAYRQFLQEEQTARFDQYPLNRTQFQNFVRSSPGGQSLTDAEIQKLFDQLKDGNQDLRTLLEKTARRAADAAQQKRRAEVETTIRSLKSVLSGTAARDIVLEDTIPNAPDGTVVNAFVQGGVIHLNAKVVDSEQTVYFVVGHELVHLAKDSAGEQIITDILDTFRALEAQGRIGNADLARKVRSMDHWLEETRRRYGSIMEGDTRWTAEEEVAGDLMGSIFSRPEVLNAFTQARPALAERVIRWLRQLVQKLRKNPGSDSTAATLAQLAERFAKALDRAAHTDLQEGRPVDLDTEIYYSLAFDSKFMDQAEQKNQGQVEQPVMDQARKDRERVAKYLNQFRDKLHLPPDIMGDTWVPNTRYGSAEENAPLCIRGLAAEAMMDQVAEALERPLSLEDTLTISQELFRFTDKPECLYCFEAMERKAYRQALGSYIQQRNDVLEDLASGMTYQEAFQKFLHGRNPTKNLKQRFRMWATIKTRITLSDLATPARMAEAIGRKPVLAKQITDADNYARHAARIKKRIGFAAYNNHILRWRPQRIEAMNQNYGMRMYSSSDFSPAFVLEDMQRITDAAIRGLKVLAYTKELDFVRIFAPTGMNINVSLFGYDDGKGRIVQDAMQGADWAEARALREQFPGVSTVFVATNDTQVEWALDQDWIDIVTPLHLIRTGAKVASYFGWTNYKDMSKDIKRVKDGWTKGRDADSIYPNEHQNNKEMYLAACEDNHLTPRFEKWVNHPNYMKLVNETRMPEGATKPVQPVFDTDVALQSLERMKEQGGYYVPIGGSAEAMLGIAKEIAGKLPKKSTYTWSPDILDEGYSTAGLKWARDKGILSKADVARFWEAIANISKRGYYTPRSERGEYIIESGNKLIFTDGDFKAPQVSRVIVFNDTFEDTMAFAKAVIYDEERYSTERGETLRIVKDVFGDAYAVEYTNTDHSFRAR